MGVIGKKLQEKIDKTNIVKYGDTIANITGYDITTNTASIRFLNPNGGTQLIADNISFSLQGGGTSSAAPKIGQKCIISFLSNNLLTPIITDLFDDEYYDNVYSRKTMKDQGAFLVSNSIYGVYLDTGKIRPMIDDYLDDASPTKYQFLTDYTGIDTGSDVRKRLMMIDKYGESEEGITNMDTKSTIKLKENGDIDIFVANNTGIRINPESKSISFFGKEAIMNMDSWTINVPNVKINGNLEVTGEVKSGGNS